MLTDYYRARDWAATGMPSQDKLNQLGLVDEGARTEKEVAMQRS
jgi:aldehyde:ferredoxin oxidoreductase